MKKRILFLLIFFSSCQQAALQSSFQQQQIQSIPELEIEKLIVTPNEEGPQDFILAIKQAQKSIHLKMFHLTNFKVVDALIEANQRGVEVQVILDRKSTWLKSYSKAFFKLQKNQVDVQLSTTGFSITHEKSMVIDGTKAFITAINLTKNYQVTRDFGVVVTNHEIIEEIESVFAADRKNASEATSRTPLLKNPYLVWSPINSQSKIVALIQSSKKTIDLQVENFGDEEIQNALIKAAQKGIQVRVLVPLCDKNPNPLHNVKYIQQMMKHGILAQVMPEVSTALQPYMHSKMILVDHKNIYIGSVNFSKNSTQKARELGIIFSNQKIAAQIQNYFEQDWKQSILLPEKRGRLRCFLKMRII